MWEVEEKKGRKGKRARVYRGREELSASFCFVLLCSTLLCLVLFCSTLLFPSRLISSPLVSSSRSKKENYQKASEQINKSTSSKCVSRPYE